MAHWRPAEYRDRAALSVFEIAKTARPWEEEVQRAFRGLRPPVARDRVLLVGEVDGIIVAAVRAWIDPEDQRFVHIQLIGVALEQRGVGDSLGDEALDAVVTFIARDCADTIAELVVSANIHPSNASSERLFSRNGFVLDSQPADSPYRQWLGLRKIG